MSKVKGSCLCGAITYHASGDIGAPTVCHCSQCRKQSGHLWASAWAYDDAISISGTPTWYEATPGVTRGFCPTCGSFLFWKDSKDPWTCFSMGSIDGTTNQNVKKHIYTADKGDYYLIHPSEPQT